MGGKSAEAFRTISEVADLIGTPAHVLRFWETKFGQIRPVKRAGGRRYYRPADVALIDGIRRLLHDDGMTIRGVQKILREKGLRHVAALSRYSDGIEAAEEEAAAPPPAPPARVASPVAGAQAGGSGPAPDAAAEAPSVPAPLPAPAVPEPEMPEPEMSEPEAMDFAEAEPEPEDPVLPPHVEESEPVAATPEIEAELPPAPRRTRPIAPADTPELPFGDLPRSAPPPAPRRLPPGPAALPVSALLRRLTPHSAPVAALARYEERLASLAERLSAPGPRA